MKLLRGLAVLIVFAISPAFASTHGISTINPISQLNIGGGDELAQNVTNMFKMGEAFNNGSIPPSTYDADGMPVQNFSGLISYNIPQNIDCTVATGTCTISWPSTRAVGKLNFLIQTAINCVSTGGPTITNCSGSGNFTISPATGVAGLVTFNFTSAGQVTYRWDGSATNYAPGSGEWAFVTQANASLYASGKWWTPLFETTNIGGLHTKMLRTMGWSESYNGGNGSNEVKFECRPQLSNFSWIAGQWCPTWQSSSITVAGTGAGQVGQYTAAASTRTPLTGWVGNEILIGGFPAAAPNISITNTASNGGNVQLTVSSSAALTPGQAILINFVGGTTEANGRTTILSVDDSTHITIPVAFVHAFTSSSSAFVGYQTLTITGKTGGLSKFIVSNSTAGASVASGPGNVFYDGLLDYLLYTSGPISGGPPLEAQAQLANDTNNDLWTVYPEWAENDYITQEANTLYAALNTNWHPESCNEGWNFGYPCTQWETQRGAKLGISTITPQQYQGLHIRQIMDLVAASNWSGSLSRVDRLYMWQAFTGPGDTSISNSMLGSTLSPTNNSALCTFLGGTFSGTCSGAPDYSQSPNRPVDGVNSGGFAPYFCGLGLTGQSVDCGSTAPTSFDLPNLQNIGDNMIAGNTSTAIGAIDALTRQGRNRVQSVTASGTTFTTPAAHNLSVGNWIRFDVSGGTAYSGVNLQVLYQVLTTSSVGCAGSVVCNFTAAPWLNGNSTGVAVNAGTVGTGTMTVGYTGAQGSQSIFNAVNNAFTKWQNMVATAFAPAPALGTLGLRWYEGAPESTPPTTGQASAISLVTPSVPVGVTGTTHGTTTVDGVSSVAGLYVGMSPSAADITGAPTIVSINTGCTNPCFIMSAVASGSNAGEAITVSGTSALAASTIAAAITAWKNDPMAAATIKAYYQAFMGTDPAWLTYQAMPNAKSPSHLVLCGSSIWALGPSCTAGSTFYQLYNGIAQFNFLLKRDLDPASNDNDPMWLEKAA